MADTTALRARLEAVAGERYELGAEVGRGGIAVVFAARDRRLHRDVAIKVLPPDLAFRTEVRARFLREGETAARLNHPHVVPIYAVDERDGVAYMVMALVHGESLAQRLKRERRIPWEAGVRLLAEVADALACAHAGGVVHRDIKPDNILLDAESGRALVTDFGIARIMESTGERLTLPGVAMGTPAFMSPEQATGEGAVDGRSDIYSLGVVGYLLLSGGLPFTAPTTAAMLVAQVTAVPPPLGDRIPGLPAAVAAVVHRCLEKRPEHRWPDAGALRDALRQTLRGAPAARVGGAAGSPPPPPPGARPAGVAADAADPRRAAHWSPPSMVAPPAPTALAGDGQAQPGTAPSAVPLEVQVARFRRTLLLQLLLLGGLAALNAATSTFPWVLFPAVGIGMGWIGQLGRLRAQGVRRRDLLSGRLSGGGHGAGRDGPHSVQGASVEDRREALWRLVGGSSLSASSLISTVRQSVDDRIVIADASAALSDADRVLVPDAEPTADALLDRIGAAAVALDRLAQDLPGEDPSLLDARIAAVASEPDSAPNRERRMQLLVRQRDSLLDLASRRDTLARQLDAAALTLRTLRVDLVRLRLSGVGAAIGENPGATQEAQALSRDIARAIEVADEIRRG